MRSIRSFKAILVGAAAVFLPFAAQAASPVTCHNFTNTDGSTPVATLMNSGITNNVGTWLYGTTLNGGANGLGTVFRIKSNCTGYQLLHSFTGGVDGKNPWGGLIKVGAGFYGTAQAGGNYGYGTAYRMTPTGTLTTVHHFNLTDGSSPSSALLYTGGFLWGTTSSGGANTLGSVYKMTTLGAVTTIHSFTGTGIGKDGQNPRSELVRLGAYLYGTVQSGGQNGFGEMFRVTVSNGIFGIMHYFLGAPNDGATPVGALLPVGTKLYGTTQAGGAHNIGTVYKFDPAFGAEAPIYSFSGGTADGSAPQSALVLYGVSPLSPGSLVGTTFDGGAAGNGTIFNITFTGTESVLYSFPGGAPGAKPYSALLVVNTAALPDVFGTTNYGGLNDNGKIYKTHLP